jgi:hypothetical protein
MGDPIAHSLLRDGTIPERDPGPNGPCENVPLSQNRGVAPGAGMDTAVPTGPDELREEPRCREFHSTVFTQPDRPG